MDNGFPMLTMLAVIRILQGRMKLSEVPPTIREAVEYELELAMGKSWLDELKLQEEQD